MTYAVRRAIRYIKRSLPIPLDVMVELDNQGVDIATLESTHSQ